ncbi:MAG: hypothetical protein Q7S84_00225 [bacterium]|nr:hypothetical protein [bacterium]
MPQTIPVQELQKILDGFVEETEALRRVHEENIRGIVRRVEGRRREELLRDIAFEERDE